MLYFMLELHVDCPNGIPILKLAQDPKCDRSTDIIVVDESMGVHCEEVMKPPSPKDLLKALLGRQELIQHFVSGLKTPRLEDVPSSPTRFWMRRVGSEAPNNWICLSTRKADKRFGRRSGTPTQNYKCLMALALPEVSESPTLYNPADVIDMFSAMCAVISECETTGGTCMGKVLSYMYHAFVARPNKLHHLFGHPPENQHCLLVFAMPVQQKQESRQWLSKKMCFKTFGAQDVANESSSFSGRKLVNKLAKVFGQDKNTVRRISEEFVRMRAAYAGKTGSTEVPAIATLMLKFSDKASAAKAFGCIQTHEFPATDKDVEKVGTWISGMCRSSVAMMMHHPKHVPGFQKFACSRFWDSTLLQGGGKMMKEFLDNILISMFLFALVFMYLNPASAPVVIVVLSSVLYLYIN